MFGSGGHLAFSHVWQLQARYFPLRGCNMGTLQDPRKDDTAGSEKQGGYSCYRLQAAAANATPGNGSATPPHARDLYGVVREACAQQNVKWPVECQVIEEKVRHLVDWPVYPEEFYEPTGTELRPQPVGDEMGRVVYQYYPTSSVNYFSRSCVGGNKYLNDDVRPPLDDENDTTLQFESRFECGNLGKAVQVSECYYELHLRADMYTSRHTQWFYFAVSNTRKDITYRFSIVNLTKGDSLYNHGMRPLMYSRKEGDLHGVGWRRCATNIVYFKNHDSNDATCYDSDDDGEDDAPSYTLSFNVTFPHDHDTVHLAHCYPYSYSDLQEHLLSIQNDPFKASVCRQRVLCRSLAGNPVYLLTITSHDNDDDSKRKRAVVLSARVHPGETPSSWIMKGVLDFLTADHPKAHELRSQFIFKIIPMLNPDGVIVGNHRCSLVGRDLNRQYKMVVKEMFPAIWHTKAMVRRLMDEYGVVMYGDFHAHSRKHNIFIYGCENRRNQDNHLREQIFPLLLHYNGGDKFSFRSCKFKVHRCKEGTARVVVWMMGVLHSYTMEASFGGASEGPRAGTHYNIHDFQSMGRQFCETLFEYFDPQPIKEKLRNKLWSRLIKKGSSADEPASIDFSETNSSSEESDRQVTPVRLRKKKLVRNPRRKGVGSRTSVAQVVERVTTQMRMEKCERRSKSSQHSRSGSSGSPVGSCREPPERDRGGRHRRDSAVDSGPEDSTLSKSLPDTKPCLKKLLEKPTSSSVLDLHSGRTSLRPTQYRLEEALPLPCSAPPLRRFSHSLIRPPLLQSSSSSREGLSSPAPPERHVTGSETLALRFNSNRHKENSHSDGCEADGREPQELGGYLDGTTKSYMERMEELVATRLAISDTEEGSVGVWWDGEPNSRLHPNTSSRQPEALEPVVAKTRLHDPRRPARPTRPPPIAFTGRPTHRGASQLHRATLTRRGKLNDHAFSRRREKEYGHFLLPPDSRVRHSNASLQYLDSPPSDSGLDNDHVLWLRKSTVESVDDVGESVLNGNLAYHRYSSQPSHLGMGPCDDLQVSGEEVVLRLSVPTSIRVTSPSRKGERIRRGGGRKSSARNLIAREVEIKAEDEELCADIATCDTLFLDTSAQETPELLAARNLKGKVKKKKNAKAAADGRKNNEGEEPANIEGVDGSASSSPGKVVGQSEEVSGNTQPDLKVKKKIKIVIGKKTRPKISKKIIVEKDASP
ncbi:cytosolic carboxypeptidase 2-like isoform X2 [Eriocheir sinensis]|uniref:cytosolic carboxypeptidase 2-like isoform X2 n=1 Tax=Eriocheir sinensis TaxID=95602 RepID=UPI0021CA6946|nr:cytosolic carboxypeptidase 2-like isoform X2 [Eriocheir sinensis]